MLARIADQLGDAVKAHRLGIEQGGAENLRMMTFHPGRGVGDLGEARGMALGKAVAAEALDLLEGPLGEIGRVALLDHAPDHLFLEFADPSSRFECCHRTTERVGASGFETRTHDRHLHRLFLKERHS